MSTKKQMMTIDLINRKIEEHIRKDDKRDEIDSEWVEKAIAFTLEGLNFMVLDRFPNPPDHIQWFSENTQNKYNPLFLIPNRASIYACVRHFRQEGFRVQLVQKRNEHSYLVPSGGPQSTETWVAETLIGIRLWGWNTSFVKANEAIPREHFENLNLLGEFAGDFP